MDCGEHCCCPRATEMRRPSSLICPCISSFPSLFRLQRGTELTHSSARGAARLGGSRHAWGDARPDRALASIDCYARFIRARCCYQSHTMRAVWAVACLTNELQVNFASGEKRRKATDAGKTYAFQTEMGCHVKIRAPARGGFNGAT
jgi:hypothetical protein